MTTSNKEKHSLSQQLAPAEPVVQDPVFPRDELVRKSTRHEPPPEKELPQYRGSTSDRPPEQLPADITLPVDTASIPRSEITRKSTRIQRSPEKQIANHIKSPEQPNTEPPPSDDMKSDPKKSDNAKEGKKPKADKSGRSKLKSDMPNDQLIPLDELPKEQTEEPLSCEPPVVVVNDQPLLRRPIRRSRIEPKENEYYNCKASLCIGITLIIIGILEIILNTIGLLFQHFLRDPPTNILFYLAPGFWCSIFFILSGTFGVVSARRKAAWSIVTHLVVATLAAVFSCILMAMCGWGLNKEILIRDETQSTLPHLSSLILLCLMALGALIALPLAICSCILCCKAFCRKLTGENGYDDATPITS